MIKKLDDQQLRENFSEKKSIIVATNIRIMIFLQIDLKNVCFLKIIFHIDMKIDAIAILNKHIDQIIEINIETIEIS